MIIRRGKYSIPNTIVTLYHKDYGCVINTQINIRKKYNLHQAKLSVLVLGRIKHHKGWALTKEVAMNAKVYNKLL